MKAKSAYHKDRPTQEIISFENVLLHNYMQVKEHWLQGFHIHNNDKGL
jgi:hypothetical protein